MSEPYWINKLHTLPWRRLFTSHSLVHTPESANMVAVEPLMPWTIFNIMPKKRTKLTSYWRLNIIICIICRNYSCWDYPQGWVVWLVSKGNRNCCELIYSSTVLLKFEWFIYPLQPNQFSWGQTEQLGAHRQWHIGYRQRYQYLVKLKSSFTSKFWKS